MAFITITHSLEETGCTIIGMSPYDYVGLKAEFTNTKLVEITRITPITYDPFLKKLFKCYIPFGKLN